MYNIAHAYVTDLAVDRAIRIERFFKRQNAYTTIIIRSAHTRKIAVLIVGRRENNCFENKLVVRGIFAASFVRRSVGGLRAHMYTRRVDLLKTRFIWAQPSSEV